MRVWQRLIGFAVFVLCGQLMLAPFWLDRTPRKGLVEIGYFEETESKTLLAFSGQQSTALPSVGISRTGQLSILPGSTVAISLDDGAEYVVTSETRAMAPYVVIGSEESNTFVDPLVPVVVDNQVTLAPWDPAIPWREDRDRLTHVTSSCGGQQMTIRHTNSEALVELRIGRCAFTVPCLPHRVMAVIAGPNWVSIDRKGGWPRANKIRSLPLGICTAVVSLGGAMLTMLVGGALCAASAIGLALIAVWFPLQGLFVLALILLGTWPVTAWKSLRTYLPATSRSIRVCSWLVLTTAPFAVVCLVLARSPDHRPVPLASSRGTCMLLGYSAVRGDGLRRPVQDAISAVLGGECSKCGGQIAVRAQGGETLAWVRDQVCGLPKSIGASELIFFGGGNDDFFWGSRRGRVNDAITLLNFAIDRPTSAAWSRLFHTAAEASLKMLPMQESALRETIECAKTQGSRFWFVHDFLAWDLESGRDKVRQQMVEARRSVTELAGARFIDVYSVLKDSAGVSWFNDFIHPSEIGHQRIARLICSGLREQ